MLIFLVVALTNNRYFVFQPSEVELWSAPAGPHLCKMTTSYHSSFSSCEDTLFPVSNSRDCERRAALEEEEARKST